MAEKQKEVPETIKILGIECKARRESEKKGGGIALNMGTEAYRGELAKEGATEQVLSATSTALSSFSRKVVKELAELAKKRGEETPITLNAGSGDFSQKIKLSPVVERTFNNPTTHQKETKTYYGTIDAELHLNWGKGVKGEEGVAAWVEKEMESFFSKKSKK